MWMSDRLSCDQVDAEFVIPRYVAGTLSPPEGAAFEEHLLTCERCQQALTLAVAIRGALPKAKGGRTRDVPWFGLSLATLAVAAALAMVVLLPRDRVPESMQALGGLTQPPVYLGVSVRQAPSQPDSLFADAMAAYAMGDYTVAAAELPRAIAAGADAVPAQFFAGASLLMIDRPTDAVEAFRSVIAAGDTPYLAEARYYLAKALLRLGQTDEALRELRTAAADGAEISGEARALADSVEAVAGR
jgi:tetratricopeptide (TPR) repeat protein